MNEGFWTALLAFPFLQRALIAAWLASIACGAIGSFVVVKRIGFLAGGIAHAVLGGMGIALYLGLDPMAGALVAAVFSALLVGWVTLTWREYEDTLISAIWAVGMAIGVLFIALTPGYDKDLMSYLFGNVLLVGARDLWRMAALDLLLVAAVALGYRQFVAVAFDEHFAAQRGLRVRLVYLGLLVLVAITVVLLIQIVGLILVIALLTLPSAIAAHYTRRLGGMILLSMGIGVTLASIGLAVSFQRDWPGGATIIIVTGLAYLMSTLLHIARRRR